MVRSSHNVSTSLVMQTQGLTDTVTCKSYIDWRYEVLLLQTLHQLPIVHVHHGVRNSSAANQNWFFRHRVVNFTSMYEYNKDLLARSKLVTDIPNTSLTSTFPQLWVFTHVLSCVGGGPPELLMLPPRSVKETDLGLHVFSVCPICGLCSWVSVSSRRGSTLGFKSCKRTKNTIENKH